MVGSGNSGRGLRHQCFSICQIALLVNNRRRCLDQVNVELTLKRSWITSMKGKKPQRKLLKPKGLRNRFKIENMFNCNFKTSRGIIDICWFNQGKTGKDRWIHLAHIWGSLAGLSLGSPYPRTGIRNGLDKCNIATSPVTQNRPTALGVESPSL